MLHNNAAEVGAAEFEFGSKQLQLSVSDFWQLVKEAVHCVGLPISNRLLFQVPKVESEILLCEAPGKIALYLLIQIRLRTNIW